VLRHDSGLHPKTTLLGVLALIGAGFSWFWVTALVAHARTSLPGSARPSLYEVLVGAFTDFLDTLGIGSFATTTSLYKLGGAVEDGAIPGTLNVGHALPTLAQAFIYIAIVRVEMTTLVLMIGAAVAGAWLGAGVVARWPTRKIQVALGAALLGAAGLLIGQLFDLFPRGGDTLGLHGRLLAIGLLGNLGLGALMTLGIGLYAPCMILVSLLGMNPTTAFPIMMGSCAFLMPVASLRFISRSAYSPSAALGLTVGGVPAVLVAAWIVRSLPLHAVRGLVTAVVVYTAYTMLRSAARDRAVTKVSSP
jgi:uncharacterized membrane protein YfcA